MTRLEMLLYLAVESAWIQRNGHLQNLETEVVDGFATGFCPQHKTRQRRTWPERFTAV